MIHRTLDGQPIWECHIYAVVEDAVKAGLLDMSLADFRDQLRSYDTPAEREDYIQLLWDRL